MSSPPEPDPTPDEACATLRGGIRRTRKLALEARDRLSELTSDTVYPGPAAFILAGTPDDLPEPADPAVPDSSVHDPLAADVDPARLA